MKQSSKHNITAFVLAGGLSRRFGEDKALYQYRGKPLITWPLKQLKPYFDKLFIIAKDESTYHHLGFPILEDQLPYQTPLAGIYTGLKCSSTDWNFFVGCDMPFLTHDVIETMTQAIPDKRQPIKIIVPQTPQGLEPIAAIYHKSLANVIINDQDTISSLRGFIRSRNCKIIDFKSSKPFTNVNTREQLPHPD